MADGAFYKHRLWQTVVVICFLWAFGVDFSFRAVVGVFSVCVLCAFCFFSCAVGRSPRGGRAPRAPRAAPQCVSSAKTWKKTETKTETRTAACSAGRNCGLLVGRLCGRVVLSRAALVDASSASMRPQLRTRLALINHSHIDSMRPQLRPRWLSAAAMNQPSIHQGLPVGGGGG